jgi:hypothetical protein
MRPVMALVLLLASFAFPVQSQDSADPLIIQGIIASQIDAFRNDDAAAAYSFAAPQIKAMFPTPDIFMEMVRTGYRQVYRPQSFVFDPLRRENGQWLQPVRLIGPDGRPVVATYIMERQPDGEWKIAGVYLLQGSDQSA